MTYRKIPIAYDELKLMLRSGLDVYDNNNDSIYNMARMYWWPLLVTLEKGRTIDTYLHTY